MKCAERRENAIICGRKAHAKGGEVAFQRDKRRERFGRDLVQSKLKKKWRARGWWRLLCEGGDGHSGGKG